VKRGPIPARCPSHVTLRVRRGIPSLRSQRFVAEFNASLSEASEREDFRVCQFSIQRDHLHRYYVRPLRTPREVRNALAYVLLNARKHWRQWTGTNPPVRLDVASSGAWFDGWRRSPPAIGPARIRAVALPQFWLLAKGWRHHGLIDPAETPG
jgi:hypothetical protein